VSVFGILDQSAILECDLRLDAKGGHMSRKVASARRAWLWFFCSLLSLPAQAGQTRLSIAVRPADSAAGWAPARALSELLTADLTRSGLPGLRFMADPHGAGPAGRPAPMQRGDAGLDLLVELGGEQAAAGEGRLVVELIVTASDPLRGLTLFRKAVSSPPYSAGKAAAMAAGKRALRGASAALSDWLKEYLAEAARQGRWLRVELIAAPAPVRKAVRNELAARCRKVEAGSAPGTFDARCLLPATRLFVQLLQSVGSSQAWDESRCKRMVAGRLLRLYCKSH
jgi:hypothetical protein